jgi:ubiquinol-cytochrome c reductase cytochrome c subunit
MSIGPLIFFRRCVSLIMVAAVASIICADRIFANDAMFAGSAERGKVAFVKHGCWQCHGFEGQGSVATSNGAVLAPNPAPFETFASFVRSTNRSMPAYREAILSNADLADIYAFLQSIPETSNYRNIPLLNR